MCSSSASSAIGAFYVKPANYHPFAPNGLTGIQAGAAIIFFAFIGFDAVSTTAEETQEPAAATSRAGSSGASRSAR